MGKDRKRPARAEDKPKQVRRPDRREHDVNDVLDRYGRSVFSQDILRLPRR